MVGVIREITERYFTKFTDAQIEKFLEILEGSFKFARTFNDQVYLRYCLWKNGFNQELHQMPGLLKQEKEALSVYMTLIYTTYTKKERDSAARERLLYKFIDQIIKMMSQYTAKHEEFLECLKKSRRVEVNTQNRSVATIPSQEELKENEEDNSIEGVLKRLKMHELERDISNLRTLLAVVVFPKLANIEPEEMHDKLKEIVQGLVNVSVYSFARCYTCFTDPNNTNCQKTVDSSVESADSTIRLLLNKYFDYCITNMNPKS